MKIVYQQIRPSPDDPFMVEILTECVCGSRSRTGYPKLDIVMSERKRTPKDKFDRSAGWTVTINNRAKYQPIKVGQW